MHKYICDYRYGNKYCLKLCMACKGFLTRHIKKPNLPKNNECCGDSCPNCVWDTYFKNKEIYDKQVTETLQTAFVNGKNREESMKNTWDFFIQERQQ